MDRLYTLQALRGIAAVLVVLFHATQIGRTPDGIVAFKGFFSFGFCGVHIFFVLSGFLISYIHRSDIGCPASLMSYLKKRIIRVYPMHFIVLVMISVGYFLMNDGNTSYFNNILANLVLLKMPPEYINPVTWTLSFEILFYLLFSLLILNVWFGGSFFFVWIFGIVSVSVFHVKLALIPGFHYVFHKYSVLFFIGMISAFFAVNLKKSKGIYNVFCVSFSFLSVVLFLLTVVFYFRHNIVNWDNWYIQTGFGVSSGMFLICAFHDRWNDFFEKSFLKELGDASYSIYLLHFFLLKYIIVECGKFFSIDDVLSVNILFCISVVFVVFIGYLSHKCIEKPLLRKMRELLVS